MTIYQKVVDGFQFKLTGYKFTGSLYLEHNDKLSF